MSRAGMAGAAAGIAATVFSPSVDAKGPNLDGLTNATSNPHVLTVSAAELAALRGDSVPFGMEQEGGSGRMGPEAADPAQSSPGPVATQAAPATQEVSIEQLQKDHASLSQKLFVVTELNKLRRTIGETLREAGADAVAQLDGLDNLRGKVLGEKRSGPGDDRNPDEAAQEINEKMRGLDDRLRVFREDTQGKLREQQDLVTRTRIDLRRVDGRVDAMLERARTLPISPEMHLAFQGGPVDAVVVQLALAQEVKPGAEPKPVPTDREDLERANTRLSEDVEAATREGETRGKANEDRCADGSVKAKVGKLERDYEEGLRSSAGQGQGPGQLPPLSSLSPDEVLKGIERAGQLLDSAEAHSAQWGNHWWGMVNEAIGEQGRINQGRR